MQEIAHDLAQLTNATTQLSEHVSRLTRTAEDLAENLGCQVTATDDAAKGKPLRRRDFKDALEVVLETRERIAHIEKLIAAIAQLQAQTFGSKQPKIARHYQESRAIALCV